jgi:2-dehydropantoate 2-reductase
LDDIVKRELLHSLLSEIDQVAKASGIYFDRDMISDTIEKIQSFPYETTSSMQRDFERSGARTELDTITGFIVRTGQKLNLPTPTFNKVYMELLQSK